MVPATAECVFGDRLGQDHIPTPAPGSKTRLTDRPLDPLRRALIAASTMLAAVLVTLEATIIAVALPQIQASVGASPEQIIWIMTAYVVAAAVATPLSGWLASRHGRKEIMVGTVGLFTLASIACGLAPNLPLLVAFRILQGATGAAIIPLSQATLLDIFPRERHGQAMAIFGMGSMVGGIIGPALGGVLTDWLSWHAIFLVNVPFGLLACVGMYFFMDPSQKQAQARFDVFGFASLSVFLMSFQLMIDRGEQLDWFDSLEIWIEAAAMGLFGYLFLVHIATSKAPFIRPALFLDRNFLVGSILSVIMAILAFSAVPQFNLMMQQTLGYPVLLTGLIQVPRGIASLVTMFVTGILITRLDPRFLMLFGLLVTAAGFKVFANMSLESHQDEIILAGILLSIGNGLIFVPLSTMVFATLNPKLRNEGAAMFALVRNLGQAVGISMLQIITIRNASIVQSRLSEGVRPDSPAFHHARPEFDLLSPEGMLSMFREVSRQSAMVSYIDTFWLLFILSIVVIPLLVLLRTDKAGA